jgi:Na+/H+-translocating membrane pyrophosphatase
MPDQFKFAAPIFAFGLVAFGFLGMGPVTIAVDSYGPVTANAQSVFELSQLESLPNINVPASAHLATVRGCSASARAVCATVSCRRPRWSRIWQKVS